MICQQENLVVVDLERPTTKCAHHCVGVWLLQSLKLCNFSGVYSANSVVQTFIYLCFLGADADRHPIPDAGAGKNTVSYDE